ncbi:hypothetical protein CEUSTIGMA_g11356.t1 [Chlamydomonas eustigma]|uniref:BACK domain-containing protein n=1 Tax=Chlamydomonas eustigma TaxID=1157962 RepID=A0A250XM14_9CHLO|nr:hypothetical protein CEUSTIGMA_g11356.t1 [Chlamydomonas eustigma]|eukprot:GAX83932.1 hypothetical protein CEUSTIGMA_g11356.t1 [Chlamydomonas eustigma]
MDIGSMFDQDEYSDILLVLRTRLDTQVTESQYLEGDQEVTTSSEDTPSEITVEADQDDKEKHNTRALEGMLRDIPPSHESKNLNAKNSSGIILEGDISIPAHALVLATGSSYFKARFSHIWAPSSTVTASCPLPALRLPAEKQLIIDSNEVASRFCMSTCMKACMHALASIPYELLSHEALIQIYHHFQLSLNTTLVDDDILDIYTVKHNILYNAREQLLDMFKDVPVMLSLNNSKGQGLLSQFLLLPYEAVLEWSQAEKLVIQSENCVLALLTKWVEDSVAGKTSSKDQLAVLVKQIRLIQLTPTYFSHFRKLPWVCQVLEDRNHQDLSSAWCLMQLRHTIYFSNKMMLSTTESAAVGYEKELQLPMSYWAHPSIPSRWLSSRRSGQLPDVQHTLVWRLSTHDIEVLKKEEELVSAQKMYCCGYLFELRVTVVKNRNTVEGAREGTLIYSVGCFLAASVSCIGVEEVVFMGGLGYKKSHVDPNIINRRNFSSAVLKKVGSGTGYTDFFRICGPSVDEVLQVVLVDGCLILEGVISAVH